MQDAWKNVLLSTLAPSDMSGISKSFPTSRANQSRCYWEELTTLWLGIACYAFSHRLFEELAAIHNSGTGQGVANRQ